ncbi:MAG: hypothetical protein OEQ25_02255 [Gammaproteobacteria bacterium]|nr:hypothetical protein [Gammaproteobacteria bacterium]MDH3505937.1 hypothetical protein [Gammaproteobacteria bacterium]
MQQRSNIHWRFVSQRALLICATIIAVPIVFVVVADSLDPETSNDEAAAIAGLESIAWPRETSARPPVPAPPTNAAPVADLITGLQQRLASQPDDVKGWVLLAQSYAFVADEHGVEGALARAVALGFDEADLRQRIELASQSPQTSAIR